MKPFLSVIAFALFIAGYVPYIASILKGRTRPAKATWIIWAGLDVIMAVGMIHAGTLNGQMIGACFGATTVAVLAIRRGNPGWTTVDKVSFAGAALGLAAWGVSGDPSFGIIACLAIIVIGAVPNMLTVWRAPHRENIPAWSLFQASCVAATLAIPQWTVAGAAQPLTFLAITTVMFSLLLHRRRIVQPE